MTGAELAEFMSTVLQLGLHDDFGKLVQTITTAYEKIDMAAFDILIWPFLKALRHLCKLTDSVPTNHTDSYGLLFQGILAAYITRFVRREPARPTDWKFPPKGCSQPSCTNCKTLDRFLTHPSQQTERFKTVLDCRKHISNRISGEVGLSKNTDKANSPHTLVVTKTDQRWRDEHVQWEFRCTTARNKMRELEPELGKLLGGRYEQIAGLGGVKIQRRGGGERGREPLASVQQPGKRKAEEGDGDRAGARKKMKGLENRGGAGVVCGFDVRYMVLDLSLYVRGGFDGRDDAV